jgi:hypothetical protein
MFLLARAVPGRTLRQGRDAQPPLCIKRREEVRMREEGKVAGPQ